jgi:hypothetical protein
VLLPSLFTVWLLAATSHFAHQTIMCSRSTMNLFSAIFLHEMMPAYPITHSRSTYFMSLSFNTSARTVTACYSCLGLSLRYCRVFDMLVVPPSGLIASSNLNCCRPLANTKGGCQDSECPICTLLCPLLWDHFHIPSLTLCTQKLVCTPHVNASSVLCLIW